MNAREALDLLADGYELGADLEADAHYEEACEVLHRTILAAEPASQPTGSST